MASDGIPIRPTFRCKGWEATPSAFSTWEYATANDGLFPYDCAASPDNPSPHRFFDDDEDDDDRLYREAREDLAELEDLLEEARYRKDDETAAFLEREIQMQEDYLTSLLI